MWENIVWRNRNKWVLLLVGSSGEQRGSSGWLEGASGGLDGSSCEQGGSSSGREGASGGFSSWDEHGCSEQEYRADNFFSYIKVFQSLNDGEGTILIIIEFNADFWYFDIQFSGCLAHAYTHTSIYTIYVNGKDRRGMQFILDCKTEVNPQNKIILYNLIFLMHLCEKKSSC